MLRNYRQAQMIMENPEEFGFFPKGKSKDISIAPPAGSGVIDKIELTENFIEGRRKAFEDYCEKWATIKAAIQAKEADDHFFVIQMYYFAEDLDGNFTGKKYTFEDIANELSERGINRTVRCLRGWRTKLVQDMAVLIFGADAALTIEQR